MFWLVLCLPFVSGWDLLFLQLIEWLSRGAKKVTWEPVVAIFIGLLAPALMGSQGLMTMIAQAEQLQLILYQTTLISKRTPSYSPSAIMIPILFGMHKKWREFGQMYDHQYKLVTCRIPIMIICVVK